MKNKLVFTILLALSGLKMYASGGPAMNIYNNCFYTIDFLVYAKESGSSPGFCGNPVNVITLLPNYYMLFGDIGDVCVIGPGWLSGYNCTTPPAATGGQWTMVAVNRNGAYPAVSVGISTCASGTTATVPGCSPSTAVTWSYDSGTNTYRIQVD